jgi:hypothetical protein
MDPNATEADCEFDMDAATFASWGVGQCASPPPASGTAWHDP